MESDLIVFKIKGWYTQNGKEEQMDLAKIHISKSGNINTVGTDVVGNFEIKGKFHHDGAVTFKKHYIGKHTVDYEGKVTERMIQGRWSVQGLSDDFRIKIKGKRWVGWYEQNGKKTDMNAFFKFDDDEKVGFGIGFDTVGTSIWHGIIQENNKAVLSKQYIGKHEVIYSGDYTGKVFKGRWEIKGMCSGDFELERT